MIGAGPRDLVVARDRDVERGDMIDATYHKHTCFPIIMRLNVMWNLIPNEQNLNCM